MDILLKDILNNLNCVSFTGPSSKIEIKSTIEKQGEDDTQSDSTVYKFRVPKGKIVTEINWYSGSLIKQIRVYSKGMKQLVASYEGFYTHHGSFHVPIIEECIMVFEGELSNLEVTCYGYYNFNPSKPCYFAYDCKHRHHRGIIERKFSALKKMKIPYFLPEKDDRLKSPNAILVYFP